MWISKKPSGKSRVNFPAYSPYAVAEHMALRNLVGEFTKRMGQGLYFSLTTYGLTCTAKPWGGGTGKIGKIFISICKGFGMKVLAFGPADKNLDAGIRI